MGAEAIIALVLANLPSILKAGGAVVSFISGIRDAAKQTQQWDATHEAAFQQLLANASAQPEWQPDPK